MHAGDPRELGFEMRNRAQVWIVGVEITKRPAQEREQFRFMMITLGANLDQLDKISRGLRAQIILADAGERIFEDDFGQRGRLRSACAMSICDLLPPRSRLQKRDRACQRMEFWCGV